jgi:hypothetical protein
LPTFKRLATLKPEKNFFAEMKIEKKLVEQIQFMNKQSSSADELV